MLQAAATTLGLIHHQTVYNLRNSHRNAVVGILVTILQSSLMVIGFLAFFMVMGQRSAPLRGDFMIFLMSGIFIFMTHMQAISAVAASHSVSNAIGRHEPINAAILISSAALAALYRQTISAAALLTLYHMAIKPLEVEYWQGVLFMYLLGWFSGCCIGLVFLGVRPWAPKFVAILTPLYMRVNMIASGKMFVANMLPNILLPWFLWNPLFHAIDQARGYIFINYTPQKTDPYYAIWFSLAAMTVGLLLNFATRKFESLSWNAAR